MSRAILCGLDGSPDSRAALDVAAKLSEWLGSRLVLAHVAEVAHVPYAAAYPIVPAERLADLADAEDAELIVVGSRGRGAFKAAFLGSVSNSLVGVARCPVLIVPRPVLRTHRERRGGNLAGQRGEATDDRAVTIARSNTS